MCYMVPLICGWEWFPKDKGLVTGTCLGGYGFGSFIFSQVSTALVNPKGESPELTDPENPDINFYDWDVAGRVPYMIRTLVYIWAGLALIGVLLVERKPDGADSAVLQQSDIETVNVAETEEYD